MDLGLTCEIISNPQLGRQGKGVSQLVKELKMPGQEPSPEYAVDTFFYPGVVEMGIVKSDGNDTSYRR